MRDDAGFGEFIETPPFTGYKGAGPSHHIVCSRQDTQVKVDIIIHIGREDAAAPEEALQELKAALEKVGKKLE
jgi:dienelactone hydrolase